MFLTILEYVTRKIRTFFAYHSTVWSLNTLTDRDLADLGIDRSEIKSVALLDATKRFSTN